MIQIPFHFFRRLSNEKANSVCWNLGTSRIYWYFRVASIIWSNLNSQEKKFKLHKTEPEKMLNAFDIGYFDAYILLWCLAECHASKSWWKGLCVHLTACASDIITLPCLHVTILKQIVSSKKSSNLTYRFSWSHSKKVCHHGAEARCKTRLGNEAKFKLCKTDDIITLLPVPAGDVQQISLNVIETLSW